MFYKEYEQLSEQSRELQSKLNTCKSEDRPKLIDKIEEIERKRQRAKQLSMCG